MISYFLWFGHSRNKDCIEKKYSKLTMDKISQIDFEQLSTCTPCLVQPIITIDIKFTKCHYHVTYRNQAYHDLMFLSSYTEESQIICWIQLPHHTTGFICKLTDQTSILNGCGIVQS